MELVWLWNPAPSSQVGHVTGGGGARARAGWGLGATVGHVMWSSRNHPAKKNCYRLNEMNSGLGCQLQFPRVC